MYANERRNARAALCLMFAFASTLYWIMHISDVIKFLGVMQAFFKRCALTVIPGINIANAA